LTVAAICSTTSKPNHWPEIHIDPAWLLTATVLRVSERQRQLGHWVDLVANELGAMVAVSRKAYDFVFMDCQMLEMDGYKATRGIRKQETSLGTCR